MNETIIFHHGNSLNEEPKVTIGNSSEMCSSKEEYSSVQPNISNLNSNVYTVATLTKNAKIKYLESLQDL